MAGRSKAPQTAGRRALKVAMDNLLRAAVRLESIDPSAGERLRKTGADALTLAVQRSIRSSESESERRTDAGTY